MVAKLVMGAALLRQLPIPTFYLTGISLVLLGEAIESPHYEVMLKEVDFEIRLYKNISWLSSPVQGASTSFQKSTKDGFHRLYQYIHGANLNSSQIPITAPVLTTSINTPQQPATYFVKLFLSTSYGINPPQPGPELNLQVERWRTRCIAARKFSGFAKDDNVNKEVDALVSNLNEHVKGDASFVVDKSTYSIAQYNASYHLTERLNEVWINVIGSGGRSVC